jgi:hypothetical protein
MKQTQIDTLVKSTATVVRSYVERALAPIVLRLEHIEAATAQNILDRIEALENRKAEKGEPGTSVTLEDVRPMLQQMVDAIPRAKDGASVTVDDVRPLIAEAVAEIPRPKDGQSVTADDVRPMLEEMVAALPPAKSVMLEDIRPLVDEAVAAIPRPKDGASVTIDDVRPLLTELVDAIPRPKDGQSVTIDDIRPLVEKAVADAPKVPGPPGPEGKPGRDASDLSTIMAIAGERAEAAIDKKFDAASIDTPDSGRTFVFNFGKAHEVKTAIPLDRGVWKGGEFEHGDGVTLGGHFWIAQCKTTAKPGESPDWRQAVQRGRNGKDFRPDDGPKGGSPVRLA